MVSKNRKVVLFTGGGTAGHVTPNMALISVLREEYDIQYIGRRAGIEKDLIESMDVPYHGINSGKLRRYFDWKNFTDLFRILHGWLQAIRLIWKIKPNLLFSKGGFVSCPPVWAAWLFRVPVIIHESDMTPGLANRLSIPFAKKVCVSFEEALKHVGAKGIHTGLPIRQAIIQGDRSNGLKICAFMDVKPVILVMGGSQGATAINTCIRNALDKLLVNFQVCHLCGKGNLADIKKFGYHQMEYAREELADLFAATDLMISRAGATSLFELLACQIPSILIPLPKATSRGDQILNAEAFEKAGYAEVLHQEDLNEAILVEMIHKLHQNRSTYIENMKTSDLGSATDKIIGIMKSLIDD